MSDLCRDDVWSGRSTRAGGHALWGGDLADMMLGPGSESFKNTIKMYTHVTCISLIMCKKCVQSEFDRFYITSKRGLLVTILLWLWRECVCVTSARVRSSGNAVDCLRYSLPYSVFMSSFNSIFQTAKKHIFVLLHLGCQDADLHLRKVSLLASVSSLHVWPQWARPLNQEYLRA